MLNGEKSSTAVYTYTTACLATSPANHLIIVVIPGRVNHIWLQFVSPVYRQIYLWPDAIGIFNVQDYDVDQVQPIKCLLLVTNPSLLPA